MFKVGDKVARKAEFKKQGWLIACAESGMNPMLPEYTVSEVQNEGRIIYLKESKEQPWSWEWSRFILCENKIEANE